MKIMKTMFPPGYHNGYAAKYACGHMMYGCSIVHYVPMCMSCYKAIVDITGRTHYFYDCICNVLVLCRELLMITYVIYTYIDRCGRK